MNCKYHACTKEVGPSNGPRIRVFCNDNCKSKYYVDRNRISRKLEAVKYKGGKCERCGYDKCPYALDFHHRDPSKKSFAISSVPHTRSWARVKEEIDKCDLLCANCHREAELLSRPEKFHVLKELFEKFGYKL